LSDIPNDLRYTRSHEWLRSLPNGQVEVGITHHAQSSLGDLVFVDLPQAGRAVSAGEACAVVESVKAASDIYSPVDGVIVAGNAAVAAAPELVNSDPYAAGWLMRIEPRAGAARDGLLSAAEYAQLLADDSH
jgi:glycine cleavage system H protein